MEACSWVKWVYEKKNNVSEHERRVKRPYARPGPRTCNAASASLGPYGSLHSWCWHKKYLTEGSEDTDMLNNKERIHAAGAIVIYNFTRVQRSARDFPVPAFSH